MDNWVLNQMKSKLHIALREAMKLRGVKQADIVARTGFTQTYISQIMTGDAFPPTDTLILFCDAMDIPVYVIMYAATTTNPLEHILIKFKEMDIYFNQYYKS